jgi:hypothetical protein
MNQTNTNGATKPSESYSRREVGKVAWRNVINELLDSEKEDLCDLKMLRRKLTDAESLKLVAALLERKTERVIELTLLLRYKEKHQDIGEDK